ncbi:MAG: potassium channel protein [Spirochaetales bacterium]|nr:potassium channel protein [Spirochaetales bacterium]
MTSFRRFLIALFLIVFLILGGTLGFYLIEDWSLIDSLYMTFVTVSTVGFGEIHPLSPAGKQFMMLFIMVSLLTIGFTLTTLISFIFEGQFLHTVKERRMKRFLSSVKDHHIICGFGNVGKETAAEFTRKSVRFIVIEKELEDSDLSRFPDINFIHGDATEEEVLQEARIDRAKCLISCLPEDQQNVYVVLTARQLNPSLHIVSKSSDAGASKKIMAAGADRVISPKLIAGRRLASLSLHPSIVNFLDILSSGADGAMRIESIRIEIGSPLIDKSMKDSGIGQHTGAIIIGVLDPDGKARMNQSSLATLSSINLREGDELIALGNEEQIISLEAFATGKERRRLALKRKQI